MQCKYIMADKTICGEEISVNRQSYSGYQHTRDKTNNGEKIDWLHWASPVNEGPQQSRKVFVPCSECGQLGSDNPKHNIFATSGGHQFNASV